MKKIKGMTIKVQLVMCICFLSVVTLLVGIVGIRSINEAADRGKAIYTEGLLPCLNLAGVDQQLTDIHTYYLHVAYGGEAADLTKLQEKIDAQQKIIDVYGGYQLDEKSKSLYEELVANFNEYHNAVYYHIKNINALTEAASKEEMNRVISYAEKAQVSLNSLYEVAQENALLKEQENESQATILARSLSVIMVVGILISMIIVYLLIVGIAKQLREILVAVEQMSRGKLDVELDIRSNNEIGKLANYFDKMVRNVKEVIMNIEAASEQVHMGAKQVAHTSSLLAQGATEQATTIEELTAAVEEINTQIKLNADHAQSMNDIAIDTKVVVEKSHEEMKQMLKAMEDINHSSSEVSKIIKVIDDIAFQTNILALNAAVEAARAGQHGKGFTVVAEEVRNLAARSAEAAKETTSMIESSIKNAQVGMKLAQGASDELNRVVEGIKKVADLTGEISNSCIEQSVGIEQIGEGALQISNVIQSNSATSEEAAAASEELAGQAELMRSEVSKFETNKKYAVSGNYEAIKENESYEGSRQYSSKIGDTDFGKY